MKNQSFDSGIAAAQTMRLSKAGGSFFSQSYALDDNPVLGYGHPLTGVGLAGLIVLVHHNFPDPVDPINLLKHNVSLYPHSKMHIGQ
jgi:hypothetical protein